MFLWTYLYLWHANRRGIQTHGCPNVVTYRKASPPFQMGPHICRGMEGAGMQPGKCKHSSQNNSKVGWLPPQTSAVREGWHRDAHSPEEEKDRCKQESHIHNPPVCHRGDSSVSPNAGGRKGEGGCAAIQPYGSKHLPHSARRGGGVGIKKAQGPRRTGRGLGFPVGRAQERANASRHRGGG